MMSVGSLTGTLPDGVSTLLPVEMQEQQAAVQIQKIARGRQARKYVARRRRRFNRAATKIQSRARGMRDRARVRHLRLQEKAATDLQRIGRGRMGRNYVRDLKRSNLHNHSATLMQACVRGFFGRKRMRALWGLVSAAKLAQESADALKPKVCHPCLYRGVLKFSPQGSVRCACAQRPGLPRACHSG